MEIGRYFYGGFVMPKEQVHFHAEGAWMVARKLAIGIIKCSLASKIFIPINPQEKTDVTKDTWKLVSKRMISDVHAIFQFKSSKYKSAGILPYFDHCGKYYAVKRHV